MKVEPPIRLCDEQSVQTSHEYLSERTHLEQEDVIKDMKRCVLSLNRGSFVEHGLCAVRRIFPDDASHFADGAAEQWEMNDECFLPARWL